jgi:hypothetical protein
LSGFFVCASGFLSLMLTWLCGGCLMLEYQKSAAAAQPRQHPSVWSRLLNSDIRSQSE